MSLPCDTQLLVGFQIPRFHPSLCRQTQKTTLSLAKLTSIKTYTFQTLTHKLTQVMADVFEARADISCLRLCRNTTRHDRLTRCVYKFMMYIHMLMLTQRLCGVMQGKKKIKWYAISVLCTWYIFANRFDSREAHKEDKHLLLV